MSGGAAPRPGGRAHGPGGQRWTPGRACAGPRRRPCAWTPAADPGPRPRTPPQTLLGPGPPPSDHLGPRPTCAQGPLPPQPTCAPEALCPRTSPVPQDTSTCRPHLGPATDLPVPRDRCPETTCVHRPTCAPEPLTHRLHRTFTYRPRLPTILSGAPSRQIPPGPSVPPQCSDLGRRDPSAKRGKPQCPTLVLPADPRPPGLISWPLPSCSKPKAFPSLSPLFQTHHLEGLNSLILTSIPSPNFPNLHLRILVSR
ncbi:basic proline-rich protein-like [Sciurus carolinensis]|uniref:basic proline-rich protein-like n=1 Tax=Sciurus carolinensis TaxID=30640 RepID=UPI001FB248E6|nr:basic proline-rich protein-like [Sciurus carolinensis]